MHWQGLRRVSGPGVDPVTLAEAKLHLRVDVDDDDAYITALIGAAREMVEEVLRRALISQDWQLTLDTWPSSPFELPLPPLQSAVVDYTDLAGASHTLATTVYGVDSASEPGRVYLKDGQTWPSETLAEAGGVQVTFTAGYGDAGEDVPQALRQALLLLVGHLYENREAVTDTRALQTTPLAFEYLLWPWRVMTF